MFHVEQMQATVAFDLQTRLSYGLRHDPGI